MIRQILRKVYKGYWAFYTWSFLIAAFGFGALELYARLGGEFAYAAKTQTGLLGLYVFSFIAIYAFTLMDEPQKNRLRPLTRLPLIGFLLGFALSPLKMGVVLVVVEALLFIYALKTKDRARYSARAQMKAAIMAPLVLIGPPWFLLLWFLWSFSFKNAAVNAAIVKGKMLDYDKTLMKNDGHNE